MRKGESIERASSSGNRGMEMGMELARGGGWREGAPPLRVWHVTTNIAFRQSGSFFLASEREREREAEGESDPYGTKMAPGRRAKS